MNYYLRGGLGVFSVPAAPAYENCSPLDPACVARNLALDVAYQIARDGAQMQQNLDQCTQNAQNATSQEQYDATMARCAQAAAMSAYAVDTGQTPAYNEGVNQPIPKPAVPASSGSAPAYSGTAAGVPARGGQITFTSSRGGQALQVGDTWLVAVTGASPNAPVSVSGSMPSGSFSGSSMGSTDSNGNYSKSGTAGAGDVGAWQESWAVGGAPSGSFSFTVAPASAPGVKFATGGGTPAGSVPAGGAAASSSSTVIGGFDLSTIPWWGWAGAAGVALFAFGRGGR